MKLNRDYTHTRISEVHFFRKGDVLRRLGISRVVVKKIFSEDGVIMIQAQTINSFDNMSNTKTISYPELEMLSMFRVEEPIEFKNK